MKRFYRWAGLAVTAAAAVYFVIYAVEHMAAMPPLRWSAKSYAGVIGALALYGVVLAMSASAWHLLLRGSGESPRPAQALVIFLLAQFAKYIPGNISQYIGRVTLAGVHGFKAPRVVFVMTLEAAWSIVAAVLVAVAALVSGGAELFGDAPQLPSAWQLGLVGAAAAIVPVGAHWMLNAWRPGPIRRLMGEKMVRAPGAGVLLACLLLYILSFYVAGAIADLLARSLFGAAESHLWLVAGVFAVAWVAGFLTPGAPGGLGVREAILVAALGPLYGGGGAVAIAVSLRIVTTLGDGLGFAVGFLMRYRLAATRPDSNLTATSSITTLDKEPGFKILPKNRQNGQRTQE